MSDFHVGSNGTARRSGNLTHHQVIDAEYEDITNKPEAKVSPFWGGWCLFVVGLIASALLGWLWWLPAGLIGFGISMAYLATCMHEIKDPDEAILFRFGKRMRRLGSGWYLAIPHLYDIFPIEKGWVRVEFSDSDVYTGDKPPRKFEVSGAVFFRPRDDEESLKKFLLMPPEQMKAKVQDVALSEARRQFGKRTTENLLGHKAGIEDDARLRLTEEFGANGYEVGDYEISRMKSGSVEIRDLGKARGEANEDMANPLKDNWPGAVAIVGQAFADQISATLKGAARKAAPQATGAGDPANPSGSQAFTLTPELAKKLAELLRTNT